MSDKEKISKLHHPDKFEAIFKEYFKALSFYSLKIVKDMDSAKEIVHSVFISLWEKRKELDYDSHLKSYLYTSVHNRSLNFIRDRAKFYKGDFSDIEIISENLEKDIFTAELESEITDAIASLPPRCSEIFKLSRYEGKKYKEIASDLGISVKTVEIQMSKALKILREKLKDYLPALLLWIIIQLLKF